jgi:hypothetical protein
MNQYSYLNVNTNTREFTLLRNILPIRTFHTLEEFFKLLSSVSLNETIKVIDVQSLLYPFYLEPSKISLIPEFIVLDNTGNFYTLQRFNYASNINASARLECCLSSIPYYIIDNILLTCNPLNKDFVFNNSCDVEMNTYCMNNMNTAKCYSWLYNAMPRMETNINIIMTPYCTNNLFSPICKIYIDALRKNQNDLLIDNILTNVWNNTKDKRLECSFNKNYAHKVNAPKVCWNYECMNTPDYLLLSTDFKSKSFCQLYSCNIILTSVVINNKSTIKISCSSEVNQSNSLAKIALNNKRVNIPNFIPYLIIPFILLLT